MDREICRDAEKNRIIEKVEYSVLLQSKTIQGEQAETSDPSGCPRNRGESQRKLQPWQYLIVGLKFGRQQDSRIPPEADKKDAQSDAKVVLGRLFKQTEFA